MMMMALRLLSGTLTFSLYRRPHPFWTSSPNRFRREGFPPRLEIPLSLGSHFPFSSAVHLAVLISTDAHKTPVDRSVLSGQKHTLLSIGEW